MCGSQRLFPHSPPTSTKRLPSHPHTTPHKTHRATSHHSFADSLLLMAASISAAPSSFRGSWSTSLLGDHYPHLAMSVPVPTRARAARPLRSQPVMKNVNEGKGLFAPLVVVTRQIVGKKRFNQIRGKAIALHSQVITEFCKSIGADAKQRQGLIRLAKKNGERLGFLA